MIVTSQTALAAELRINRKQVQGYLARGMPGHDGEYDTWACLDWLREPGNPWGRIAAKDEDKEELEKEQLRVKIDRDKLKLEKEAGSVVDREAILAKFTRMGHRIRSRLQAIPAEIGSSVPPDQRASIIATWKEKIVLVLSEIEHWEGDGGS